ncbi:MAG: hypothetical protein AAFO04_15250 [Cyanobacteria bacterium J06592_8]
MFQSVQLIYPGIAYFCNEQQNKTQETCKKPLKTNPFTTYRDPKTGKWLVIREQNPSQLSSFRQQTVNGV